VAEFGISRQELAGISSGWRSQAGTITGIQWSAFTNVTGSGSDVLAAVRDCGAPAAEAMRAVGDRFSTLAQKVDTFAANVVAQDGPVGSAIAELPSR
jgi:hypothetical protein